jgi:flavin reductase (DIM6/NTAB) family NADH-FMN oxidoreductase RutF
MEREPAGATVAPISVEQQRWLRSMMARFATGVSIVAARHGPLLAGMTANAIASISIDPPLMMASISRKSETHGAILTSHSFAVSVLASGQQTLADCFAQPTTAAKLQRFCDAPWHDAETGSPILDGAIAFFDCRLVAQHPGGDHTLFVGEIVAAGFEEDAEPLIWYGSRYRRLQADPPD